MVNEKVQVIKIAADVAAGGITVASIIGWLPSIAAGLSVIWLLWQMGEKLYKYFKGEKK